MDRHPAAVVALANACSVRRPTGSREREPHDGLADARSASELLGPFLSRTVRAGELPAVRELQRCVVALVDALVDRQAPPVGSLNRLAARHPSTRALELNPDGGVRAVVRFGRPSAAAILTERVISEVAELDPLRLRRCARPECGWVFYDQTRSGTQRWHSERPCGLRERQRRHRAKRTTTTAERGSGDPGDGS